MRGGAGNDYYTVERSGDQTIEDIAGPAGGIDTVYASVNRTLGANIENLVLQGTAGLRGIGNELANKMTGNSGANLLQGLAGADRLDGGGGNDTLEGGAQNDTLTGGAGADRFRFAASDAGVDRILDFDQSADRFELTGLFTALSIAPNGDAVLTHAGGTVRVAAPPSLSLAQWNALVLPLGAKAVSAAAMADDTAVHAPAAHASDLALAPHGDWTFA
jgi:Ca2+-binding RTX toxin-like protein